MSAAEVGNAYVHARATAWVSDEPIPGIVRVELTDGDGVVWRFEDKSPIFDANGVLTADARYPVDLDLACTVLYSEGSGDDERVVISTAEPWGIETPDGRHKFTMRPTQVLRR